MLAATYSIKRALKLPLFPLAHGNKSIIAAGPLGAPLSRYRDVPIEFIGRLCLVRGCLVHGATGWIIGPYGQPGGERTGTGIGRVDVPTKQHGGDPAGAGQLERRGGGLSARTGDPAVVEQQEAGSVRRRA